jgi:hypothetical protein
VRERSHIGSGEVVPDQQAAPHRLEHCLSMRFRQLRQRLDVGCLEGVGRCAAQQVAVLAHDRVLHLVG